MRVLITGSRTWTDARVIRAALTRHYRPGIVLVSGACPRGADAIAEAAGASSAARSSATLPSGIGYGRSAGFRRNAEIVRLGASVCVAFIRDGSRGASHTAQLAEQAGIPVGRYTAG
jgi:hypothetical protein